jgi:hypothetical protein
MRALVAGIHVLQVRAEPKTWMAGRNKNVDGRNKSGDEVPEQSFIIENLEMH